jgi:hypothetical protein
MLDPAGLREVLRNFLLGDACDGAVGAEHDGAGGCGALVDGEDVAGHEVLGKHPPSSADFVIDGYFWAAG